MNRVQLPNYKGDLKFLRRTPHLQDLRLDSAFPDRDFTDINEIPDLPELESLTIRNVGLISLTDLHFKFPALEHLDL